MSRQETKDLLKEWRMFLKEATPTAKKSKKSKTRPCVFCSRRSTCNGYANYWEQFFLSLIFK